MAEISKDKFKVIGIDKNASNEISRPNITYFQDAWRRLKQNKVAIGSLILLILIALMTIIGPYLTSYRYWTTDSTIVNMAPNSEHWFGTDMLGRDLFARVWKGGRVSIIIGILGTIIEMTIGVIYGGISGYFGGIVDDIMMRIVEILLSVPYLIVVIIISLILGKGVISLVIAMTITGWCGMARIIRGQILQIREQEYVLAAQALGARPSRVIKKHLLPNTIGILIVNITLDVPSFIFGEAFLSYIGLGIQSPNTSWGSLASAAQPNLMFYPYQLFFPALFISLTMLSFNLLGDGLRDALDPKMRQ
ncbi:ABC transporter permease [Clostridium sporogenes]|uniref:ABC transporter permease n=2 Tax=Clostridium TaxID=1485 RepID=A0A6M0SW75_CLOBO|nr:ABC transporter permease [Clostridium sporogenes]NFA59393.1 ABC transporter permease [Clostridium botulinum]MDS1004647.1 ABC transporter permease [Clostridium sporogenes]NFI75299.1 ABC transporter permease [Clostridium sporogenes]NFL72161.1 ABC transporter permease [Clostridium sporogenes]NFM24182.1 ABC transporter permease [Clostridium sporogenes]